MDQNSGSRRQRNFTIKQINMENLHPAAQVATIVMSSLVTIVCILAFLTDFFDKK